MLAAWQAEGKHFMSGLIASRNGRLFIFDVTYDYDRAGQALEKGVGWISSWSELAREEARLTPAGYPNGWLQAAIIARVVFESEGGRNA